MQRGAWQAAAARVGLEATCLGPVELLYIFSSADIQPRAVPVQNICHPLDYSFLFAKLSPSFAKKKKVEEKTERHTTARSSFSRIQA